MAGQYGTISYAKPYTATVESWGSMMFIFMFPTSSRIAHVVPGYFQTIEISAVPSAGM